MRNVMWGVAVAAAALSIAGCGKKGTQEPVERVADPVPVRVMVLGQSRFTEVGEYFGEVAAHRGATLTCLSGGTVTTINAVEGSRVNAGQSLARIDAEKAETLLETAQLSEKVSFDAYERSKQHLADGNVSQLALDQAQLTWLSAKASRIDAEKLREGALCITPIGGTVLSRLVNINDRLVPGMPTFTVADLSQMRVTVGIPEGDMAGVRQGNEARVYLSMYPDTVWTGTIRYLGNEMSRRTMSFSAEIQFANPGGRVKPGTTARVEVVRRVLEKQIVVPTRAIVLEGGTRSVMLVEEDKAVRMEIEVGPASGTETVVMSGLSSGVRLIVEGVNLVANATPVRVMEN